MFIMRRKIEIGQASINVKQCKVMMIMKMAKIRMIVKVVR